MGRGVSKWFAGGIFFQCKCRNVRNVNYIGKLCYKMHKFSNYKVKTKYNSNLFYINKL